MRKFIALIILISFVSSCGSTKESSSRLKYFDENNNEISKSKFKRIRSSNKLLDIPGDSINHKRLTLRERRGKLNNVEDLILKLGESTRLNLNSKDPIVIIYHPGKDRCNSTGMATSSWLQNWYGTMEEGLKQIGDIDPLYIYKDIDGLENYDGILNWEKDPNQIVEKLFFNYHYPCKSFVVISLEGEYISYFGEFGYNYVWEAAQILSK